MKPGKPERLPLSRAVLVWIMASLFGWAVIVAIAIGTLRSLDLIGVPDGGVVIAEGDEAAPDAEEIERLRAIAPAAGPQAISSPSSAPSP